LLQELSSHSARPRALSQVAFCEDPVTATRVVGCTAEIRRRRMGDGQRELQLVACGRQRFEVQASVHPVCFVGISVLLARQRSAARAWAAASASRNGLRVRGSASRCEHAFSPPALLLSSWHGGHPPQAHGRWSARAAICCMRAAAL
jgi:hypothetical protein